MSDESGKVCVVGAGGQAKVVIATLLAAGREVQGVYDDNPQKHGRRILGFEVMGTIADFANLNERRAIIAIGDNATRKKIAEQLIGTCWVTAVHPNAVVHSSVRLGGGTVIFAGAVVQPDAVIGAHCIVNTAASVDHECVLGNHVHVASGACLCGAVCVGEGALLGAASVASPGVSLGAWVNIGPGALVVRNVPSGATAVARSAVIRDAHGGLFRGHP